MLREVAEYPNSFGPLGSRDERIDSGRYTLCLGMGSTWNTVQRQRFPLEELDEVLAEVRAALRDRGRTRTQWEVGSSAPAGLVDALLARGLRPRHGSVRRGAGADDGAAGRGRGPRRAPRRDLRGVRGRERRPVGGVRDGRGRDRRGPGAPAGPLPRDGEPHARGVAGRRARLRRDLGPDRARAPALRRGHRPRCPRPGSVPRARPRPLGRRRRAAGRRR